MRVDEASSYREIRKSQDLDFDPLLEKLNLLDDEHLTIVVHGFHKSSLLFKDGCIRGESCMDHHLLIINVARSVRWP